jgi:predicted RND superfamily exporter protein
MKKLLRHSWLIIATTFAITVFFAIQLRHINIENTTRLYMPHESPSFTTLLNTEDTFGSMLGLGISLETGKKSIITPEYIEVIRNITDQIIQVQNVEDVDSLTNIDYIHGGNGTLSAGSLLGEDYAGTQDDIKAIKQRIINWQDMYNHVIVSDDGRATQIMIQLTPKNESGAALSSNEQMETLYKVKDIVSKAVEGHDLEVRYYGDPVMSDNSRSFVLSDLSTLVPLVIIIVLVSLYLSFHTLGGTLLPLLTVVISTIWSCGLLVMLNFTFTIMTSVIPVCLIACGSAYGIHVMTHYYIMLDKIDGPITKENNRAAILSAVNDVWVAVILAAFTTIAGFISNITSPMEPLRSFSIFSAYGVAMALLLSVVLIPAILYVTPVNRIVKPKDRRAAQLKKAGLRSVHQLRRFGGRTANEANSDTMYTLYRFFAGTKPRLSLLMLIILILSGIGIKKLVVDTALVNYFPPESKFRQDLAYVDEKLAGSNSLYFVVSGQEKGDLTKPEILEAVDSMQDYLAEKYPSIGKIVSFTTFLKRMNQVMHTPDLSGAAEFADTDAGTAGSADEAGFGFDFGDDSGDSGFDFGDAADDAGFDFGDAAADASSDTQTAAQEPYVDPNIAFAHQLNQTITYADCLNMLQAAYAAAGGKQADIADIVRELEREINYNGLAYYEIPYDTSKYPVTNRDELANLVSQYLLLLSSKDMEHFTDDMTNPGAIRIQVELRSHTTTETGKILKDARDYADKYFPEGYTLQPTGNAELDNTMTKLVLQSQMISIALSMVMVFIILSLSFKSPLAGIIGAIPLGLTILLNFMVMGFAGIHLDLFTSIISSVAIGVGIDYTIHFMETYKMLRLQSSDLEAITKETYKTSGKGIITNAIAVGLGFFVLILSKFIILRYIGILVTLVMFSSSSLAMSVIPGILNVFDPKFMHMHDAAHAKGADEAKTEK